MCPEARFHQDLTEYMSSIADKLYVISSKGDTIVPHQSSLAEGIEKQPHHQHICRIPWGHLALLQSKEVKKQNRKWILEAWNDS